MTENNDYNCTRCGIKLNMVNLHIAQARHGETHRMVCILCGQVHFLNIKVEKSVTLLSASAVKKSATVEAKVLLVGKHGDFWVVFAVPTTGYYFGGPYLSITEALLVAIQTAQDNDDTYFGGIYPEPVDHLEGI